VLPSLGVFGNQDEFDFDGIDLDALVSGRQINDQCKAVESSWQTPPVPLVSRQDNPHNNASTTTASASAFQQGSGSAQFCTPKPKLGDATPALHVTTASVSSHPVPSRHSQASVGRDPPAARFQEFPCPPQTHVSGFCSHRVPYSECTNLIQHVGEIKERLLHISDQLLDGCCMEEQTNRLRAERKSLQGLLNSIEPRKCQPNHPTSLPQTFQGDGHARQAQAGQLSLVRGTGPPRTEQLPLTMTSSEHMNTHGRQSTDSFQHNQHLRIDQYPTSAVMHNVPLEGTVTTRAFDTEPPEFAEYVPDPTLRQGIGNGDSSNLDCIQTDGCRDQRWDGQFPWSPHLVQANKDFFGNSAFRPHQRQAINATMSGQDCFILMPTGGGLGPLLPAGLCITVMGSLPVYS
jgi:hypothetical protein